MFLHAACSSVTYSRGPVSLSSQNPFGQLTVGHVGDLAQDVVSANLLIALWGAHQRLTDHGHVDFGTNTPVGGLQTKQKGA